MFPGTSVFPLFENSVFLFFSGNLYSRFFRDLRIPAFSGALYSCFFGTSVFLLFSGNPVVYSVCNYNTERTGKPTFPPDHSPFFHNFQAFFILLRNSLGVCFSGRFPVLLPAVMDRRAQTYLFFIAQYPLLQLRDTCAKRENRFIAGTIPR